MAVALFWIGFPYLMMGFSHAYWMMLACATLLGIGNNLWHPTAIPWLASRFPERKGLVMSFHSMGGNVGDAVAPLVVGALLAVFSWRDVVLMNVIPGIAMSVLILVYIGRLYKAEKSAGAAAKKPVPMTGAERMRSIATLLTDRAVVTLSIGSTFRTMTQSALLTFLPVYLARDMGYSPLWIGACMFALQAAGFVAAPIAGHLSDTIGRRQIIVSSMSMTAVVLLAMIFAGGTIWFVLLSRCWDFSCSRSAPCCRPGCWMRRRRGSAAAPSAFCSARRPPARRSARSAPACWPIITASWRRSISSPARSSSRI